MKTLDEIKQMMAAGETAEADEALKELLANEPDNLQAKMLYGTCRQLLGDEETFKRIHDEIAPEMDRLEKKEPKAEAISLWKKYHALWMSLIVGGLVLAGVSSVVVMYFGKSTKCLYAAPSEDVNSIKATQGTSLIRAKDDYEGAYNIRPNKLYGPAIQEDRVIEK